jgi:hypothetical protein
MKTENLHDEFEVPSGLEARLEALIDKLDEAEKRSKRKYRIRLWTGVAASVAVLVFAGLLLNPETEPSVSDSPVQEHANIRQIDDPEAAYSEIKKALELMSANLNRGIDECNIIFANELGKSNELIVKSLKY